MSIIVVKQLLVGLWLMVAIALQSFVAVADSTIDFAISATHATYTVNGEQTPHTHAIEHHESSQKSDLSAAESEQQSLPLSASQIEQHEHSDCHHCGHCSTPHAIWEVNAVLLTTDDRDEQIFALDNFTLQSFIDNTYRPPIT